MKILVACKLDADALEDRHGGRVRTFGQAREALPLLRDLLGIATDAVGGPLALGAVRRHRRPARQALRSL